MIKNLPECSIMCIDIRSYCASCMAIITNVHGITRLFHRFVPQESIHVYSVDESLVARMEKKLNEIGIFSVGDLSNVKFKELEKKFSVRCSILALLQR